MIRFLGELSIILRMYAGRLPDGVCGLVYVLPEARHKGVAQGLFQEMEKDCRKHGINQYYLIRATNPNVDKFYHSFENAELDEEPFLRKELKE